MKAYRECPEHMLTTSVPNAESLPHPGLTYVETVDQIVLNLEFSDYEAQKLWSVIKKNLVMFLPINPEKRCTLGS